VTPERALDIIAAYGGDSRRWPADEREAVTLLAISDPAVAAALAEARQLDALLGNWAGDVAPRAPFEAAALIPAPAVVAAPARQSRAGWWVGGAIAAALTGLIVQAPWTANAPLPPPVEVAANDIANVSPAPSAAGESEVLADDEVFAAVFTPTADEDQLI
jgi:hypothetical protein